LIVFHLLIDARHVLIESDADFLQRRLSELHDLMLNQRRDVTVLLEIENL
jgi:hypothetical protein